MPAAKPTPERLLALCLLGATLTIGCGRSPAHDPGGSQPATGAAPAPGVTVSSETQPSGSPDQGVLGRNVIADLPDRWIGEAPTFGPGQPVRATLVRFWTDTCPFCEASLPAIESLREEFGARGLRTLGVYHPKPPRPVSDAQVTAAATRLGYHGQLGVDEHWAALERMWLSGPGRRATSVSFLLDASGVVRFVHPGPEFHPSEDPAHASCNTDYHALREAIHALLDD